MFESYRASFAKNRVLMELAHEGLIDRRLESVMRSIAGNDANLSYAIELLRQGGAPNKYSAAAAVFARLSSLYERNPINGIRAVDWEWACTRALIRAGAAQSEAFTLAEDLIAMNGKVDAESLFQPSSRYKGND